jgi:tryptophan synthase alpha chain
MRKCLDKHGLSFISLIAPTTPLKRAATILRNAKGFVYYIMVMGVTGTRTKLVAGLTARVKKLRTCTDLPIAVGFGVSNGKQAREAARAADAVVVGSALVRAARENKLVPLVRELRKALGS